jgi:hypothetical protein
VCAEIGWIDPAGHFIFFYLEIFQHKFCPPVQVTITKAGFYVWKSGVTH